MLVCPICQEELKRLEHSYKCLNNHCFDISKQGYTNLVNNKVNTGDNKMMVKARNEFLNRGHYQKLVDTIKIELERLSKVKTIADCGCGEGYYTNQFIDYAELIYGFDLSKTALKLASKNSMVNYFVSSIYDLPLSDHCVDVVLNIFAPCASNEFNRIIKDGGYIIKVDPGINHLKEMKEILYDDVYLNEPKRINDLNYVYQKDLEYQVDLDQDDIKNLLMMTPYFYKTSKEASAKLLQLENLKCTISFIIYFYHNKY